MKKPKINIYFSNYYTFDFFTFIPKIRHHGLLWKDKYGTPQCELSPTTRIHWLWFELFITKGSDHYWEQWLWINNYKETKESWPWVDSQTKQSSWVEY